MTIEEVCLNGKKAETYKQALRQTFHTDLYIGYLFSECFLVNLNLPLMIF
jgi:hypothetical protein